MQKPKKTADELVGMIMAEARDYSECAGAGRPVVVQGADGWKIGVQRDGRTFSAAALKRMEEITTRLRNQFDLA